jgi:hypothetical protein|tara:strand:+ start:685 stop:870 length:186 start_codon:yes stop_codon:yes gene_type:complete
MKVRQLLSKHPFYREGEVIDTDNLSQSLKSYWQKQIKNSETDGNCEVVEEQTSIVEDNDND